MSPQGVGDRLAAVAHLELGQLVGAARGRGRPSAAAAGPARARRPRSPTCRRRTPGGRPRRRSPTSSASAAARARAPRRWPGRWCRTARPERAVDPCPVDVHGHLLSHAATCARRYRGRPRRLSGCGRSAGMCSTSDRRVRLNVCPSPSPSDSRRLTDACPMTKRSHSHGVGCSPSRWHMNTEFVPAWATRAILLPGSVDAPHRQLVLDPRDAALGEEQRARRG